MNGPRIRWYEESEKEVFDRISKNMRRLLQRGVINFDVVQSQYGNVGGGNVDVSLDQGVLYLEIKTGEPQLVPRATLTISTPRAARMGNVLVHVSEPVFYSQGERNLKNAHALVKGIDIRHFIEIAVAADMKDLTEELRSFEGWLPEIPQTPTTPASPRKHPNAVTEDQFFKGAQRVYLEWKQKGYPALSEHIDSAHFSGLTQNELDTLRSGDPEKIDSIARSAAHRAFRKQEDRLRNEYRQAREHLEKMKHLSQLVGTAATFRGRIDLQPVFEDNGAVRFDIMIELTKH